MKKNAYRKMSANEDSFWWYVARRKIINKVIKDLTLNHSRILEIGSGTGGNVNMLSDLGHYTGFEKEPLAIELAKLKNPDSLFIQGDVSEVAEKTENNYDLIALLDVLEHVEDDLGALEKIRKIINTNGSIVLTVPAHKHLWSYHDVTHHHHRRYSKKELLQLVDKAGFKVRYVSYYNFFLYPVVLLVRMFFRWNKKRTTDDVPTNFWMNNILLHLFGLEASILPRFRFPTGVSLIIVLKK